MDKEKSKYLKLLNDWKEIGWTKYSSIIEFLEYGCLEALLWDTSIMIHYCLTSANEFPIFPEDVKEAEIVLNYARKAKLIVSEFDIPVKNSKEGVRTYLGRVSDEFEKFCQNKGYINCEFHNNESHADIAANKFLEIAMRNDFIL